VERILEHLSDDIEFSSPFAIRLAASTDGIVRGRDDLHAYFAGALRKFPDLHFELERVLIGVSSITLYYRSVQNLMAAETMHFDESGRVHRVFAHYSEPTAPRVL
jgi:hypothetical protein